MYYETYRKGKRGRHRRGCVGAVIGFCLKLILFALILALIAAAALYALPPSFMNIEPSGVQLSPKAGLPGSRVNILLLGLDFLSDNAQRSDTMMIASVGYRSLKLTSLLRDTMVEIPGHGRHKLNSAYAYGGAELTMRTINESFGLNITNYIALDFSAMVDLVDAVGGIDLEIEEKEVYPMNRGAWDVCRKILAKDYNKYRRYANAEAMTESGKAHLNGIFATGYCRVRSVDNDQTRTLRQRKVFKAIMDKMRSRLYDPRMYIQLFDIVQNSMQTNLTIPELISVGEKLLMSGAFDTHRAPQDAFIRDNGSSIEITDPDGAGRDIRDFIYGT